MNWKDGRIHAGKQLLNWKDYQINTTDSSQEMKVPNLFWKVQRYKNEKLNKSRKQRAEEQLA